MRLGLLMLEKENLVGESNEKMLDHIFACHEELRRIRKELVEVQKTAPNKQSTSASQIADELEVYFDPEGDIDPRYTFDFVKEWCQQLRAL